MATDVIHRKNYRPPDYRVTHCDLRFELDREATLVTAKLRVTAQSEAARPFVLDGHETLELLSLKRNGQVMTDDRQTENSLILPGFAGEAEYEIITRISPAANSACAGLYLSGDVLVTHHEAQGFRRITFFPDRPDHLSLFSTEIMGDPALYPVMLSNGDMLEESLLADGRKRVLWQDPTPKPSYLFALAAGRLEALQDQHKDSTGKVTRLAIYAEPGQAERCQHAMASLKAAMDWDEHCYGRRYQLSRFNIVAVPDFNSGAMENTGLNIFNASNVLADPLTATDDDYYQVERVIAHEYFHNWTGNRVTIKDWFQLTLKEGLTTYRDQCFSADQGWHEIERIKSVEILRNQQFPEDSGPLAHPVRLDSYREIRNFYTTTTYKKGAELCRMLARIIGAENWHKAMDLFFTRHDGQAVDLEALITCAEEASGQDLAAFARCYAQPGTPHLDLWREKKSGGFILHAKQLPPLICGKPVVPWQSLPLPCALQLYDKTGAIRSEETLLIMDTAEKSFSFETGRLRSKTIPSLFMDFSAPIRLTHDLTTDELLVLAACDQNPFNRWQAGHELIKADFLASIRAAMAGEDLPLPEASLQLFAQQIDRMLADDYGFSAGHLARVLSLPGNRELELELDLIDPMAMQNARQHLKTTLAQTHAARFSALYAHPACQPEETYRFTPQEAGKRAVQNIALSFLIAADETHDAAAATLLTHARPGYHMTARQLALFLLYEAQDPRADAALLQFHDEFHNEPLVLNKYYSIQARAVRPDVLSRLQALTESADFSWRNPNMVKQSLGIFASNNPLFHDAEGRGYAWLADRILYLDGFNAQLAGMLARLFKDWRKLVPQQAEQMRANCAQILAHPNLSRNVAEVMRLALQGDDD